MYYLFIMLDLKEFFKWEKEKYAPDKIYFKIWGEIDCSKKAEAIDPNNVDEIMRETQKKYRQRERELYQQTIDKLPNAFFSFLYNEYYKYVLSEFKENKTS